MLASFATIRRLHALILGSALIALMLVAAPAAAAGTTIRVPEDYPTISEAIEAASDGDEILVGPGTYDEWADDIGKELTLRSSHGPGVTTLLTGTVLTSNSALIGFRVKPRDDDYQGITVWSYGDKNLIQGNVFEAGVHIRARYGAVTISQNRFNGGRCENYMILVYLDAVALIENNVLNGSQCPAVVIGTNAAAGSVVINNTITNTEGAAIVFGTSEATARNNLVAFNHVGIDGDSTSPVVENNLVYGNLGNYVDIDDQTGLNGNISADPLLAAAPDGYRLMNGSPAIDAGSEAAAPSTDFEGTNRPIDGDGAGGATTDIGAHEYGGAIGWVTGEARNEDGRGITNVCATAWDGSTHVASAATPAGGQYSLRVPAGTYTVEFHDCINGVFGGEWYGGVSTQGASTPVVVVAESTSSGVDGTLTTTHRCYGHIPTAVGVSDRQMIEGGEGTDVMMALGGSGELDGGDGNDFLCAGDSGGWRLLGGTGDDRLIGGAGDDRLGGGGGNDILIGKAGNDSLGGGTGADHLIGGADRDRLFGDKGHDILEGGSGDDVLEGYGGNDQLFGEAGDDELVGGLDNDTMDGGPGTDVLDLRGDFPVTADLNTGIATGQGDDTFSGIENLRGTDSDDLLIGDSGPNRIWGESGNDTIIGGAGADSLRGGGGDDVIVPGPGDDYANGSSGLDILDFSDAASGVTVNLTAGTANGEGRDEFADFFHIVGSDFDDHLTGSDRRNEISGRGGNDTIIGLGTADLLIGGSGDDFIDGGEGDDELKAGSGNDTVIGGPGNDTITGSSGGDTIDSGDGDDTIDGGKGADSISAGAGRDTITGGSGGDDIDGGADPDDIVSGGGADTVDGGPGKDTISTGGKRDVVDGGTGIDLIDTGSGADSVSGGDGADLIESGSGDDTVDGGSGDDLILGGSGDDSLMGSTGNDTLVGESGDDTIDGGPGVDTSSYAFAPSGINADLAAGTATGGADNDQMISIEQLVGSPHADVLTGDSADNLIEARGGDDQIDGRTGIDIVSFGASPTGVVADMGTGMAVGEGSDTFISTEWLVGSKHNDDITGSSRDDVIFGFTGLDKVSGGDGDDSLIGGKGSDELRGQGGDDFLNGEGGNDRLFGGSGFDTCVNAQNTSGCEAPDLRSSLAANEAHYDRVDSYGPALRRIDLVIRHNPPAPFSPE